MNVRSFSNSFILLSYRRCLSRTGISFIKFRLLTVISPDLYQNWHRLHSDRPLLDRSALGIQGLRHFMRTEYGPEECAQSLLGNNAYGVEMNEFVGIVPRNLRLITKDGLLMVID